jgi:hypothetical protein
LAVANAAGVSTGVAAPKMCVTELLLLLVTQTPPVLSIATELGALSASEVP